MAKTWTSSRACARCSIYSKQLPRRVGEEVGRSESPLSGGLHCRVARYYLSSSSAQRVLEAPRRSPERRGGSSGVGVGEVHGGGGGGLWPACCHDTKCSPPRHRRPGTEEIGSRFNIPNTVAVIGIFLCAVLGFLIETISYRNREKTSNIIKRIMPIIYNLYLLLPGICIEIGIDWNRLNAGIS